MSLKLSDVDSVIVRYADSLTPSQISFKLEGLLSPEQVIARLGQLLDSTDWLSTAQQDQLITLKMRQLVVELEEMPRTARNAEILIRALEAVGTRLEKRSQATERDLSQLYAFQGAVMLDAIEKALGHMRTALTQPKQQAVDPSDPNSPTKTITPSINQVEWDAALSQALRLAQLEISGHEAEAIE